MLSVLMNGQSYFEIVQGEDITINLQVMTELGTPFDLTGYTITARFVSMSRTAQVETGVTNSNPQSGVCVLAIPASDSVNILNGDRQDWELALAKTGAERLVIVKRGITVDLPTV